MDTLYVYADYGLLFLRIAIGASFLVHGIQKLRFWKNNPEDQTPKSMKNVFKILSIVEPLGAIALFAGFLTQYAAIGFIIIMIGAIYFKMFTWKTGFSNPGGWENDLIIMSGLVILLLIGAGYYSLDIYLLINKFAV